MSDPVSALSGAEYQGFARIRETGPLGMITLRAKAGTPGLERAIAAATGCALPEPRRLTRSGKNICGWMSADEFLLILPYEGAGAALAVLAQELAGQHHLAADVSDARSVFQIEGPKAAQVLQKLTPADLSVLAEDELRRSRLAQVAAAFWQEGEGWQLVCFRSVAGYVMALLSNAARPGSEI